MINNTTLPSFSQFRLSGVPSAPRTLIYLCLLAVAIELFVLGLAALGQLSLVDATESAAFMLGVGMLAVLALRRLGTGMVTLNDEGLVVKRPTASEKYKWEHIQDLRIVEATPNVPDRLSQVVILDLNRSLRIGFAGGGTDRLGIPTLLGKSV